MFNMNREKMNSYFQSLFIQVNVPEEEKSDALRRQEMHLGAARGEREHYNQLCQASKAVTEELGITHLQPS